MINVLIADDHTLVREGLKHVLNDTSDIIVVEEACNGREVLREVWKDGLDLVLLDISLPDSSGLDILKQIKRIKPKLNVLVLSMHPEEHYAMRALRAGASGYLTKDKASKELIDAIRKISLGHKYVSTSLGEKLVWELFKGSSKKADIGRPLHEKLSDREFQVLCMIASGKTATEIAKALSLSVKTVSTYRARILEKMNMKTNAQLTRYALEEEL